YEFRSATGYSDRREEPPGTLIKAVEVARAAKRLLDLDWLARAVGVTQPESSRRLWTQAPAAMLVLIQHHAALDLYASLSAEQRAALTGERGLDAATLRGSQHDLLSTL